MAAIRSRTLLLSIVLLAASLAGCAGTGGDANDGSDGTNRANGRSSRTADTPRWELGDAWTYSIKTQGFPRTETTMMVYNQTADLYRIGTTNEKQALIHSLFNVNPQIGRIQKGNLAVFEDGQPRPMYDFPITDGKTWQTDLFVSQHGGQLDAEATYSNAIETPAGTFEGYEITATNADGFELVYDYVPEIRWFTKLVVTNGQDTQLHDLRLTSFARNETGTGYFVRGDDLYDETFTGENCGFPQGCSDQILVDGASAKDGKYGPYHLVAYNVQVNLSDPDNDRAQIQITDGEGNAIYDRQFLQSQENEFTFETTRDFQPGDWSVDVQVSGGSVASVRLAGAWSYSGTVS